MYQSEQGNVVTGVSRTGAIVLNAGGLCDHGQHLKRRFAIQHSGYIYLISIGALQHGSLTEQGVGVQVRDIELVVQCHSIGRGRLAYVASDAVLSTLQHRGPEVINR